MSIYKRCDESVNELANDILREFESHQPLIDAKVKIDFVFAFASVDDQGNQTGHALIKNGVRCLGLTRKLSLKDRALGRGDAEIALDGDWWADADDAQRRALLDHELHHIAIKCDASGNPKTDDIDRPIITLRKHDVEFGWFNVVAARHGTQSMERIQARQLMDDLGQYYWPEIAVKTIKEAA